MATQPTRHEAACVLKERDSLSAHRTERHGPFVMEWMGDMQLFFWSPHTSRKQMDISHWFWKVNILKLTLPKHSGANIAIIKGWFAKAGLQKRQGPPAFPFVFFLKSLFYFLCFPYFSLFFLGFSFIFFIASKQNKMKKHQNKIKMLSPKIGWGGEPGPGNQRTLPLGGLAARIKFKCFVSAIKTIMIWLVKTIVSAVKTIVSAVKTIVLAV